MNRSVIETIVGLLVVVVAIVSVSVGYVTSSKQPSSGVTYTASFESVEGIVVNSEVKIGGVRVGAVSGITFDKDFQVILSIKVEKSISIPRDSSLEIKSAGIMGDKFVEIVPGGAEDFLAEGDAFAFTKSSTNLENFIGALVSGFVKK
jgi:phospholipid/cholesterol/gamma-HCH transport system substrate-binding protein